MIFDSFLPWRGAAAGLVVALGWAGLFRLLRRPELAGLGAGLGLAVGWVLTLGLLTGSPRQLPERLPALAVGGVLVGLVLVLAGRRGWLGAVLAALGVFGAAWWLAGGPLSQADLAAKWETSAAGERPEFIASAWLDGGPVTQVLELREASPGVSVIREQDEEEAKEKGARLAEFILPMPPPPPEG